MSTNFGPETYRHGTITGNVQRWEGGVNASGQINWENQQDQLHATLHLLLPEDQFENINLNVGKT